MKISAFKRLIKEDYPVEDQPLIEKLATVFNLFSEQLYIGFNNNISITENLLAQTFTLRLKVDANGRPDNNQIKYTLKSRPIGIQVLAVNNLTDTSPLLGAPFITFSLSGDVLNINQITGLVPNKTYELTAVIFG